jgi:pilus assembly protein CpaF
VRPHEANQMISDAMDLLVQFRIQHKVRRVIAISKVSKDLKNGDVFFEPIFRYKEESSAVEPIWEKEGELRSLLMDGR